MLKFRKPKKQKMPEIDRSKIIKNIETKKILSQGKKYGLTFDVESIIFIKRYLTQRNLNPKRFGYIKNFIGFYEEIINGKDYKEYDDPRIIIPFVKNNTREIYALQGRAIYPKQTPKYFTVIFKEKYGKLYNYYNIDKSKRVYVLEGPIDSMFLPNACALAGANVNANLIATLKKFKDIVVVFDNDISYNFDVRKPFDKIVEAGIPVFIPPHNMGVKDINDLSVVKGMSNKDIQKYIDDNVFSGVQAKIRLSLITKRRKDVL